MEKRTGRIYDRLKQKYRYCWGNNPKRAILKDRICVILHSMVANSVLVQFIDNGAKEVISRRALRKVKD